MTTLLPFVSLCGDQCLVLPSVPLDLVEDHLVVHHLQVAYKVPGLMCKLLLQHKLSVLNSLHVALHCTCITSDQWAVHDWGNQGVPACGMLCPVIYIPIPIGDGCRVSAIRMHVIILN